MRTLQEKNDPIAPAHPPPPHRMTSSPRPWGDRFADIMKLPAPRNAAVTFHTSIRLAASLGIEAPDRPDRLLGTRRGPPAQSCGGRSQWRLVALTSPFRTALRWPSGTDGDPRHLRRRSNDKAQFEPICPARQAAAWSGRRLAVRRRRLRHRAFYAHAMKRQSPGDPPSSPPSGPGRDILRSMPPFPARRPISFGKTRRSSPSTS